MVIIANFWYKKHIRLLLNPTSCNLSFMDQPTMDFYNQQAAALTERYNSIESLLGQLIHRLFKRGDKVLDIGCGSGRDLSMMLNQGLDCVGIEPSQALRKSSLVEFPELRDRIIAGALPHLPEELTGPFHGICLSAVIMHIPENLLFESALAMKHLLQAGGKLLISHCPRRNVPMKDQREENGRLFVLRSSEELQRLFEDLGFKLVELLGNEDAMGRRGIVWETLVLELELEG